MGIPGFVERLQTAVVHDLVDIIVKIFFRHQIMFPHGFADDFTDRQTRRQAGERVLEDNLHFGTHSAHLFRRQVVHFLTVKQHLATGLFAIQAQDSTARGRFATAGFPYQAHCGTALEVECYAVYGFYDPLLLPQATLDGEILFQVIDHQEVLGIIRHRCKVLIRCFGFFQFFRLCITCHYFSSFRS